LHRQLAAHNEDSDTSYEILAAGIAGVLLLGISLFGTPLMRSMVAGPVNVAAVISAVLIDLANADRGALGIGTLTPDPLLTAAAQAKANDMAQKSYFAHFDAAGKSPWDWMHEAGYRYEHAGENLAIQFSESGDVERAWLASPAHRANLLDGRFTQVGIATAEGFYQGQPTTFVVQFFGTPPAILAEPSAPVAETIEPTPIPVPPDAEVAPTPVLAADTAVSVLGVSESADTKPVDSMPQATPAPRIQPEVVRDAVTIFEASTSPFVASVKAHDTPAPLVPARERFAVSVWSSVRGAAGGAAIVFVVALLFLAYREWEAQHRRHVLFAVSLSTACALGFMVVDTALTQAPSMPALYSAIQSTQSDEHARLAPEFGFVGTPDAHRTTPTFAPLAFVRASAPSVQLASAGATELPTSTVALVTLASASLFALLVFPRRRIVRA
jgi:hypothetical protein